MKEHKSRRRFLKQSALFTTAALVHTNSFPMLHRKKYKMGLQLFTIRDAMAKDPLATLKQVKALGYEDLEVYGYDVEKGSYYGYKARDFKTLLDDLGLTVSSGHYGFSDYLEQPWEHMKRYLDNCIEGAKALDKKFITWPWLAPEYRTLDHFKKMALLLNKMGEQVTAADLGFAYHNHGFEFDEHDGQIGYDIVLKETDTALVKLQMDLYWVMHSSKKSPAAWMAEQPGRYVMWHIKDMDKRTRDYTELGNGSIDYVSMLATLPTDTLAYYYLEQGGNFAQNSMQSIADSAHYFKKHLQRFL